jgi:hypothetical protein
MYLAASVVKISAGAGRAFVHGRCVEKDYPRIVHAPACRNRWQRRVEREREREALKACGERGRASMDKLQRSPENGFIGET